MKERRGNREDARVVWAGVWVWRGGGVGCVERARGLHGKTTRDERLQLG